MTVLIAGIGNVFLGDDGFGPEVARRLVERTWPAGVAVADFGVRSLDLAYALTSGVDAVILVDAVSRGGDPGTLYVIDAADARRGPAGLDTHTMDPEQVLRYAASLGALPRVVRLVGCEPAVLAGEDDADVVVGLSVEVARVVDMAAELVAELVEELHA